VNMRRLAAMSLVSVGRAQSPLAIHRGQAAFDRAKNMPLVGLARSRSTSRRVRASSRFAAGLVEGAGRLPAGHGARDQIKRTGALMCQLWTGPRAQRAGPHRRGARRGAGGRAIRRGGLVGELGESEPPKRVRRDKQGIYQWRYGWTLQAQHPDEASPRRAEPGRAFLDLLGSQTTSPRAAPVGWSTRRCGPGSTGEAQASLQETAGPRGPNVPGAVDATATTAPSSSASERRVSNRPRS